MSLRELEAVIGRIHAMQADWGEAPELEQMRSDLEALYLGFAGIAGATFEVVDAGGVAAEMIAAPGAGSDRVILHLHGGGFSVGSARSHRHLAQWISAAAGARVLVVDYRLVPAHCFPAQLEDAKKAYRYLLELGIAPGSIAVSGDSAGGGLALSLLGALRDEGTALPACAAMQSAWADLSCRGASYREREADDPVATHAMAQAMGEQYVGEGGDLDHPWVSPVKLDYTGFPPLLLQVGAREIFLDDSSTVATNAKRDGVEVRLVEWPGMIHQWHLYAAALEEGRDAVAQLGAFIAARMSANDRG